MHIYWKLMMGGAMAAALCSTTAFAQDEGPETVVVSSSRISLKGFEAPTPVMQIGLDKIERDSKIDLGDLIRELPAAGPSQSLNNGINSTNVSQGDAGLDTVSLRNMGISRTLILFDGQRVIEGGLNVGDKIVVNGLQRIRPGAVVAPQMEEKVATAQ